MKRIFIITGSVTYALRGRDILQNKGFRATARKSTDAMKSMGCGWGIEVIDDGTAVGILKKSGVKILGVNKL